MRRGKAPAFEPDEEHVAAVRRFLVEFHDDHTRVVRAVRQALFFLRLLLPTPHRRAYRAVDRYRAFALAQVAKLVRGVELARPPDELGLLIDKVDPALHQRGEHERPPAPIGLFGLGPLTEDESEAQWAWAARVLEEARDPATPGGRRWRDTAWRRTFILVVNALEARRISCAWEGIETTDIEGTGGSLVHLREYSKRTFAHRLRRQLIDFLALRRRSLASLVGEPYKTILAITNLAADEQSRLASSLHRNMATAGAVGLVLAVLLGVEAVNSLLANFRWWSVLVGGVVLLPALASRLAILRLRRRSRDGRMVHPWDIGGAASRAYRVPSLGPDPGIRRYEIRTRPWTSGEPDMLRQDPVAKVKDELVARWRRPATLTDVIVGGQLRKLGVYAAAWIATLIGCLALRGAGVIDSTSVTVFLILSILYAILVVARRIDLWDFLDPRPIRLILLAMALLCLGAMLAGIGSAFFMLLLLLPVLYLALFQRPWRPAHWVVALLCAGLLALLVAERRAARQAVWASGAGPPAAEWRVGLDQWPHPGEGPVVVMAASGGGSRAAVYAGLTLAALGRSAPSCCGSGTGAAAQPCAKPASPTARRPPPRPCAGCGEIGDSLQAISSVSGGSLANAAHVVRKLDRRGETAETDLVMALADDFLLPTLRGALVPLQSRGEAIERHWQGLRHFQTSCPDRGAGPIRGTRPGIALGNYCLSDLADRWSEAAGTPGLPPFPMPLFNTTSLDGHDVVLTPLRKELYTRRELHDEAKRPARNPYRQKGTTWVYYRDAIYGLEDLLPGYDPMLSSAVRASANFPFGFPLVRIRPSGEQLFSPRLAWGGRGQVHLTDGGALSNSGMWSLFQLLLNKSRVLRQRGVLLIIVDAGKMPELGIKETALLALQSTIGDQAPLGQYLHRTMLDRLAQVYGGNLAVWQIDLRARGSDNVHTTWALDRGTLRRLRRTFARQWCGERADLERKWAHLKRGREPREASAGASLIDRARPPSD